MKLQIGLSLLCLVLGTVLCQETNPAETTKHEEPATETHTTTKPVPIETTTKSAETTEHKTTHTEAPTTHTEAPVTTPIAPTPPAATEPKMIHFETKCAKGQFAAQIAISFENENNKTVIQTFDVSPNATIEDNCNGWNENATSNFTLSFDWFIDHENKTRETLKIRWVRNNGDFYADEVAFKYKGLIGVVHPEIEQDALLGNLTLFKVANNKLYECTTQATTISEKDNPMTVTFTKVSIDVFVDGTSRSVDKCFTDEYSDAVPIGVGCALLGLVIIVLVAYFIGRRRSRRLAYQSV